MLRDFPYIIWLMFLGIIIILLSGFYYKSSYKQDSVVFGLNETVRTCAIANADNSSRLQNGQLFIIKEDFENDFKEKIKSNYNVKITEDAAYTFEYLDDENGASMAIRVIIKDGNTIYQSTAKINLAES